MAHNCSCEASESPIPRVDYLFKHATGSFVAAWIVGGFLALISIVYTRLHRQTLRSAAPTLRRDLYQDILLLGPVFCVTGFLTCVVPRMGHLCDTVQAFYEARVLYDFGRLIINYLAGENVHDPREAVAKATEQLSLLPPASYLAVPPLGCCLRCGPFGRIRFDAKLVHLTTRFIKQYLYVAPSVAVINLAIELQAKDDTLFDTNTAKLVVSLFGLVSVLLAVWGLFILYKATHNMLKNYRTTLKFASIKGILVIAAVQESLVSSIAEKEANNHGTPFTKAFKARFWASFFVCLEGFVLTLLLVYAFPVSEIAEEVHSEPSRSNLDNALDITLMEPSTESDAKI